MRRNEIRTRHLIVENITNHAGGAPAISGSAGGMSTGLVALAAVQKVGGQVDASASTIRESRSAATSAAALVANLPGAGSAAAPAVCRI